MIENEIKMHQEVIDGLNQEEACRLLRFALVGHPFFDSTVPEVSEYFSRKYHELGGMTPTISKKIGWG
jgi:hypothetical protein